MKSLIKKVFITGGAGYVGAVLVSKLLKAGYLVRVLDLYLFGDGFWNQHPKRENLEEIKGDIRDQELLKSSLEGCDAVIHLACISNDPSFELDPELGKSINFDAFEPLVKISKEAGVRRFIYASSSSVYGISELKDVTEDHPLRPLTDYSKFKSMCEPILLSEESSNFTTMVLRPATVCGWSPRLRLDLSVNILTHHAVVNHKIKVFGGSQLRPNIHIEDVTDLYQQLLELPREKIAGKIYNAGFQNHSIQEIAEIVQRVVSAKMPERKSIQIEVSHTDDLRSYHISSQRIHRELNFAPKHTIEDAVSDLVDAFKAGIIPNSMEDPRYYNIKTMQALVLK